MLSKTSLATKCVAICFALFLAAAGSGRNEPDRNGVQVELSTKKPLVLHVTLRSFSDSPVTLYNIHLPWISRYAMVLVPVQPDGQCLPKYYPPDDPPLGHVSLEPHGSLSGDIDLRQVLPGLEEALKKSDIHLFWAYESPQELQSTRRSGGWILLPRTT